MTTPQTKKRTTLVQRTAFTIAELLVVMLIIAILAGIAAPFIFEALNRAREFAIQNEIGQMDAAIRRFETEHGFFPPAIGSGLEINTDDDPNDPNNPNPIEVCLLYTSPSPRDRQKSRMPSSA